MTYIPKIWHGEDVWIIGGGSSIIKVFDIPNDVVMAVRNYQKPMSVFSRYMSFLKNKNVIGVNIAFKLGDWVDIAFFGDRTFGLKYRKELEEFPNYVMTCSATVAKDDNFIYIDKDRNHVTGISPYPGKICWNNSSGAAAIDLAIHLGAKRIFLLGFDMNLDQQNHQHWHNAYRREHDEQVAKRALPFTIHIKPFQKIADEAKLNDVSVYNVNPYSNINVFEKIDFRGMYELSTRKNDRDNYINGGKKETTRIMQTVDA